MYNVGDYNIHIVLTDPLNALNKYPFEFKVRSPPVFARQLVKKLDIIASNQFIYQMPVPGNNIDDLYVIHDSTLPSFIQFTFPNYIFNPNKVSDLGIFTVMGKLCHQYASTKFYFFVNVTNEPP